MFSLTTRVGKALEETTVLLLLGIYFQNLQEISIAHKDVVEQDSQHAKESLFFFISQTGRNKVTSSASVAHFATSACVSGGLSTSLVCSPSVSSPECR